MSKKVANTGIRFNFIDSFKFLNCSLEKLVSFLPDDNKFILRKHFPDSTQFNMINRKAIFPYEFVDSWGSLNVEKLPSKESFYDTLNERDISDADYERAVATFEFFGCKNIGEYSDLYLKLDVLLLADIFESFRNRMHLSHSLDPAHFLTLPGFSFQAMLRFCDVELKLLNDIEMVIFIQNSLRGGLSCCSKRYSEANNPYMEEEFDASKPEKYLFYCDVNNLYGFIMKDFLPHGDFEWVDPESVDLLNTPDDSPFGYIVEADFHIPESLHDYYNDFPFLPTREIPPNGKFPKLLTTLEDKHRYILHYRNLKQAVKYNVELVKVHRVLRFRQSQWLKSYIDLNAMHRAAATNEFDKNLYKLLNNVSKKKKIYYKKSIKKKFFVSGDFWEIS